MLRATTERHLVALGHALAFASLAVMTWLLYTSVITGNWTHTLYFNAVGEGYFEALLCTFALFGLGIGWGRGDLQD
jgi:hypothetical protein